MYILTYINVCCIVCSYKCFCRWLYITVRLSLYFEEGCLTTVILAPGARSKGIGSWGPSRASRRSGGLYIYIHIHSYVYMYIHVSIRPSIYLSTYLCVHVSDHRSICLSIHVSIHRSLSPYIYIYV